VGGGGGRREWITGKDHLSCRDATLVEEVVNVVTP